MYSFVKSSLRSILYFNINSWSYLAQIYSRQDIKQYYNLSSYFKLLQMLQNYCGIEENDSSGILLVNDNKLKNTSLAFGKLLERDGLFVSGTLIIPLGR